MLENAFGSYRVIVSEDGSRDHTVAKIKEIAEQYSSIFLVSEPTRKGYSKAVIDGLQEVTTPWVVCMD